MKSTANFITDSSLSAKYMADVIVAQALQVLIQICGLGQFLLGFFEVNTEISYFTPLYPTPGSLLVAIGKRNSRCSPYSLCGFVGNSERNHRRRFVCFSLNLRPRTRGWWPKMARTCSVSGQQKQTLSIASTLRSSSAVDCKHRGPGGQAVCLQTATTRYVSNPNPVLALSLSFHSPFPYRSC